MNGKKARQARQAARPAPTSRKAARRSGVWRSWRVEIAGVAVIALIAGSFVLPGVLNSKTPSPGARHAMAPGVEHGNGLPVGARVPAFSERDLVSGSPITNGTLANGKTLLFFSEGVMCQACLEQIKDLERLGATLSARGMRLVSITPDTPGDLRDAVSHYGITTPVISDADRSMSEAFNTLGLGMHSDSPGHAFALIESGTVRWYRDYWQAPDRTMYVAPEKLLTEIPTR